MKLLVISDLEDRELDLGIALGDPVDLIVSCGDVYRPTYELIRDVGVPVFGVHGNHDDADWPDFVTDLHRTVVEHAGLRFAGLEGCRRYKASGRYQYSEEEIEQYLRWFPAVDVFVAHSPMAGFFENKDGIHDGWPAARAYVERKEPRLYLHGHSNLPGEDRLGATRIVSVHGWSRVEID